jgi:hypothetical protein
MSIPIGNDIDFKNASFFFFVLNGSLNVLDIGISYASSETGLQI